jgi:DNA repair photolyase
MEFDKDRSGTGTREWAEVTENIQIGCANNCLYCYAAHNANRFKLRQRADWAKEEFTKRAEMTSYPARHGVVMFPSSHDITPGNVEEYIRVALLILAKGNRLLIVSKPRFECVLKMLRAFGPYREQILFRFSIGTIDSIQAEYWEPFAPSPEERICCLDLACKNKFHTSVSIEPIIGGIDDALDVVKWSRPSVTETIWIGKMNKIRLRVPAGYEEAVKEIERLQRDEKILELYGALKDDPMIRWKDSIKAVWVKYKVDQNQICCGGGLSIP